MSIRPYGTGVAPLALAPPISSGVRSRVALVGFADVATIREQWESAARLLGAADAHYETAGFAVPPHDRPHYARAVAATRAGLGDAVFTSSRTAGRHAEVDEVIGEAAAMAGAWTRHSDDETTGADDPPEVGDERPSQGKPLLE